MRHVLVHGPKACGKTRNKDQLAKAFGCRAIVDDVLSSQVKRKAGDAKVNTLFLSYEVPGKALAQLVDVVSFDDARCIIQGLDEVDPDTGRTNRAELEREIADVEACLSQAQKRLGVAFDLDRAAGKSRGFDHWHDLIDEARKP